MAVAAVALFLALTGSVVAATKIAKNSVGSTEIRNKSIKGGDIANDALTGGQINEETLGVVPRAATAGTATAATAAKTAERAATADRAGTAATAERADRAGTAATAGDADRLGGRPASDFARSDALFTVSLKMQPGDPPKVLVERDGVRLVGRCVSGVATTSGGTADVFSLYAEADADGATLSSPRSDIDGAGGAWLGPGTSESKRLAIQQSANTGARIVRFPDKGVMVTSAGGTTIFLGAAAGIRVSFGLQGATCAVTAPVVVSTL